MDFIGVVIFILGLFTGFVLAWFGLKKKDNQEETDGDNNEELKVENIINISVKYIFKQIVE